MSKLAITLLAVPAFMFLGAPSKTLTNNPESHANLGAMAQQAPLNLPSYEVSLSARAHAANHHAVSPQVMAMVSPF